MCTQIKSNIDVITNNQTLNISFQLSLFIVTKMPDKYYRSAISTVWLGTS